MFQKFYTDTLGGRFIKSLLAQTPIPLFESVVDGDHLVAGCYYVYKRFIIQCVSSGILAVEKTEVLYPSETLYPSIYLFPGTGYRGATFYVKSYVDSYDLKTHNVFKSSTNYYDSETHYHLSRYLRYLYTTTGLNLFPFYNCYNSTYFSDVELSVGDMRSVSINRVAKSKYKVVAVPILFGHSYTIALDCPTQVIMRACIHDNTGFIPEEQLSDDKQQVSADNSTTSLKETLSKSGKVYSHLRFDSPVTFRVETSSLLAMMLQHNLYLLIQLPANNDSSIVVLENYQHKTGIRCDENSVRVPSITNLSLLRMNTRNSYAFSDRLLEYLLGNVVYSEDAITQNVEKIQTALGSLFYDYKRSFIKGAHRKGIWDNDIPRLVQSLIDDYSKDNIIYDQDGNINKDTEFLIYPKGDNY